MASTCTPTTTLSVASNTKIQSIKELVDAGLCHVPSNYIRPPNERPHFQIDVNPIVECETIPVINLANMFGHNRDHIVEQVRQACLDWGVFQVLIVFSLCFIVSMNIGWWPNLQFDNNQEFIRKLIVHNQ